MIPDNKVRRSNGSIEGRSWGVNQFGIEKEDSEKTESSFSYLVVILNLAN